jgi:hypothetical protein
MDKCPKCGYKEEVYLSEHPDNLRFYFSSIPLLEAYFDTLKFTYKRLGDSTKYLIKSGVDRWTYVTYNNWGYTSARYWWISKEVYSGTTADEALRDMMLQRVNKSIDKTSQSLCRYTAYKRYLESAIDKKEDIKYIDDIGNISLWGYEYCIREK